MIFFKALDGALCPGLLLVKALPVRLVLRSDSLALPFHYIHGENAEQRTNRTVTTQADPYRRSMNTTAATAAPSPLPAITCAGV